MSSAPTRPDAAAADVEQHVRDLVVVAAPAERAAGASWARMGAAFGITADVAQHRCTPQAMDEVFGTRRADRTRTMWMPMLFR
ncbi:hypothetical protein [Kitasatospora sp. NPDC058190]|uniref:hypothetical protein n=1 Tax=Kitasatospora sp. NPDC058190 TaxID=3346371 RepID=UPI0036D97531